MEGRTVGVFVLLADGLNVIRFEGLELGFRLEGCLVGRLEGRLVGDLVGAPMTVVEQNVA